MLQIFVPLLSNPGNHKNWPPIVAQDVSQHVHSLKSTVYQVKGQVSGQTVLPMPVGVERVHHAERMLISRYTTLSLFLYIIMYVKVGPKVTYYWLVTNTHWQYEVGFKITM